MLDWLGTPVRRELAAALIDPRGTVFERLEWLGDSVLDLIVVDHRYRTKTGGCCRNRRQPDLCSDQVLGRRMVAKGLKQHLDWDPSVHRQADWVEAAIGASYLQGGWSAAVEASRRLVHRPLTMPIPGLPTGPESATPRLAEVGSYVIEMGVTWHLWQTMPLSGPGLLSARRADLASAASLLGADKSRGSSTGVRLDRLQADLARTSLERGWKAAVEQVANLLPTERPKRGRRK